ncbi:Receptor-like protein kinase [Quillaja saponaria]|uniref:Receptor-like protein kinase n=1 Tax=Quillaja saponaria TaxID=32244 RepID=A0AAD7LJJ4_QUISA|nr:Receptor-like protein kinase [Quillaja saponaria]
MFTDKSCFAAGLIPLVILVLLQLLQGSCHAQNYDSPDFCANYSSSCGKIENVSYPFRLKGDPESCGDKRCELVCENHVTVQYMNSRKYYVQAINYKNYTIRVVDAGVEYINDCSSIYNFNFTSVNDISFYQERFRKMLFFNCTNPVIDDSLYVTMDTNGSCKIDYSKEKGKRHEHIYVSIVDGLYGRELKVGCYVKTIA